MIIHALQAIFHSINEEHQKREIFDLLLNVLHNILGYSSSVYSSISNEARDSLNKLCVFLEFSLLHSFFSTFLV